MNKQSVTTLLLGFALGANVVLAAWVVSFHLNPPAVLGQTIDSQGKFTVATGKVAGKGDGVALYVISHEDHKMLVYFLNGKMFELTHVRDFSKDLRVPKFGDQNEIEIREKEDKEKK